MNLEKIGKFIASSRKKQNLTQEQLAEQLGITKNAVSKWERGLCLMDMSLLEPLSKILKVTVNEILAGEKIERNDLLQKADENIINIAKKEVENLKAIKMGTLGMTIASTILIIYGLINDLNINICLILLSVYNGVYKYCKYKYNRDKFDLQLSLVWLICAVLFFISHIIATIDVSVFTEKFIEYGFMLIFGVLIVCLGIMNFKGNISSIHWYNRRKVAKENEKQYGKYMGIGTIVVGSSLILNSILQMIFELEIFYCIIVIGVVVGLGFILYSQIKYNKGIF
ncbi:MAG: helix-turn-helix transcriptional regulator [Clostridia bacterium]|nr:helix-turn-helix transcriptional regulator [Clostridia bacterium]